MQHNGLDRRTFLKGAGITAIGAAAMGALTGCGNGYTVPAGEEPVNASAGQVPGTPSWLGQAPEVAERDITETIDTEVLVVGCRTAGLPAVISAAENGAKALGIDRTSTVLAPREDIGAIDSKLQLASFDEYPQFKIDKMEAMEDIVRYANGFINYDLVKVWANESGALIDWLTEIVERDGRLVMQFEGSVGTEGQGARDKAWATGHSPNKTDKGKEDKDFNFGVSLKEYAEEKGAEFRWSTELIKLEQDESGRVVGIIARDVNDRHYIRINATKGVILATGGYGNNLEMMEARQPWNQKMRISIGRNGTGGNPTGDGIKAALWAGGQMAPTTLVGMKASTAPHGRDPKEHGYPMHMCEILNQLTAPTYLVRTSCNTPANVNKTKQAIHKAFQNQLDGKGFSMVEIVTSCPTNWGLDPMKSLEYIEEKMLPEFPLGVVRDR